MAASLLDPCPKNPHAGLFHRRGISLAAISYGILHDQITARICVEYFTIGHPRLTDSDSPTVLALLWGVAASWRVGLPLGLGLAVAARAGRRPKLGVAQIRRPLITLLCWMFGIAFVAGLIGFLTARAGVFRLAGPVASRIPTTNTWPF